MADRDLIALAEKHGSLSHITKPKRVAGIHFTPAEFEAFCAALSATPTKADPTTIDPTDPGHDVEVLREHVRHLERHIRQLSKADERGSAEPVAWRYKVGKSYEYRPMKLTHFFYDEVNERYIQGEPLYTAPARDGSEPGLRTEPQRLRMLDAVVVLADFAKTAPGRLPGRVQDAVEFAARASAGKEQA